VHSWELWLLAARSAGQKTQPHTAQHDARPTFHGRWWLGVGREGWGRGPSPSEDAALNFGIIFSLFISISIFFVLFLSETNVTPSFLVLFCFISIFAASVLIDLITLSINPTDQIPINLGYLGLLPSYGIMWLIGLYVSKTKDILKFAIFSSLGTFVSFMISTQTYYLLSNKFPGITIQESIQTGWEYFPHSFIYTMSYLMAYWGIQSLLKKQFVSQKATAL
jgi:hypothetical protein